MPGRTKCPTCGRKYETPDRTCTYCGTTHDPPAVWMGGNAQDPHPPPKAIFRRSVGSRIVWTFALLVVLALVGLAVAAAMGALE